jgi:hypothetical protein
MESRRGRLSDEGELQSTPTRQYRHLNTHSNPTVEHVYSALLQRLAVQILHFNDDSYCEGDEE